MDVSILISRIFATVYTAFGLGFLISPNYYKKHIGMLLTKASFLFLSGFLGIAFGVVITYSHHYWENDWRMIITIFGWIILIQGILLIIAPSYAEEFKDSMLNSKYHQKYIAPFLLILGVIFGVLSILI